MRYALGIDGGGSKCDAVLIDEAGTVVGWGRGGPTHLPYDPRALVDASYSRAIAGALAEAREAELYIAGRLHEGPPRETAAQAGRIAFHLDANEVDTAFASVQQEWGIVVLSGTGSFVHGRTADGRHLHFGGLGPVLGDYGSAYDIGLLGARAAFASGWTPARRTSLADAIPRALGVAGLRDVMRRVYVDRMGRREIAALAKVVEAEARKGDRVAVDCLVRSAEELAEMAIDLVKELELVEVAFPMIAIGSVAQRSAIWWEHICRRVAEVAPRAQPLIPQFRPAVGAALLALQAMGVSWSPALLRRIADTQQPFLEAADSADDPKSD